MWIRSQDKKYLINVNFVWITSGLAVIGDFNSLENSTGATLGKYASRDEANKVLDQIEAALGEVNVFQMPEAGFSVKPETFIPDCGGDFCELITHAVPVKEGDYCDDYEKCKAAYDGGADDAMSTL